MNHVVTGLERLLEDPPIRLRGRRLGLLTNPSGIDRQLTSGIDLIHSHPALDLTALFGPEHGVRGEVQAGDHVTGGADSATGLPVHSLYGETRIPTEEMLSDIAVLMIDLQDIGVRYATYLSSVVHVMEACARYDREVVILDRPNPLGGENVAGGLLDPDFASFVGLPGLTILHGLTIGEFARFWAASHSHPEPSVIAMAGWHREMYYDETNLPWVWPSPNLPTLDSVVAYPALCLIEGTSLSEGRGTTRPFEICGSPSINAATLAKELSAIELPGIAWRPLWFTPSFSKNAGSVCGGVQLYVTDRAIWDPIETGVHLIQTVARVDPQFEWTAFEDGRYFIDMLSGGNDLRHAIDTGDDIGSMLDSWATLATTFAETRQPYLFGNYS